MWSETIRWPAPTHADPRDIGHPELGEDRVPWVTCRQALGHLSGRELGRSIRMSTRHRASRKRPDHRPSSPDAPARTLTRNTHGDGALLANDRHPPSRPDQPSRTITTKGDGRGAQGGCVIEQPERYDWPWDRPATTVQADERLAPPGHHSELGSWLSRPSTTVTCGPQVSRPGRRGRRESQGVNAVIISERAAAILQGFPPGWEFTGRTKKARWSQIGQAMPPGLARAVASSIARWLEDHRAEAARRLRDEPDPSIGG